MLDKIFAFLGFSSSENYVGLTKLIDNKPQLSTTIKPTSKKELKLSDLMRGN